MRRDGLTRLLALACALAPVVTLRALPGLSPPTLTAPTPVRAAAHPHCLAAVERQDLDSPIGALVDAISNSKSGAVNKMLTDAPSSKAVLELVSAYVERLNPVNVATALHRIAVLDKRNRVERDSTINDRRFDALMEKVIEHCPNLTPRATADIFWSCATLKHWPALLLKPLLTRLAAHLEAEALEPHHFSLIAWALATLECKPVVLLERIQTQASTLANSFSSQNCANILWGFAKLRQAKQCLIKSHFDTPPPKKRQSHEKPLQPPPPPKKKQSRPAFAHPCPPPPPKKKHRHECLSIHSPHLSDPIFPL